MSFPHNLTEIDQLTRPDHYYLDPDDECYFLGEYTARQGYAYSATNDLILNLKKTPDRRGRPEWRHKERAIVVAARALKNAFMRSWLRSATFVPIPPSKARNDPMYDDRMSRLIQAIDTNRPVDCRELSYNQKAPKLLTNVMTAPDPQRSVPYMHSILN